MGRDKNNSSLKQNRLDDKKKNSRRTTRIQNLGDDLQARQRALETTNRRSQSREERAAAKQAREKAGRNEPPSLEQEGSLPDELVSQSEVSQVSQPESPKPLEPQPLEQPFVEPPKAVLEPPQIETIAHKVEEPKLMTPEEPKKKISLTKRKKPLVPKPQPASPAESPSIEPLPSLPMIVLSRKKSSSSLIKRDPTNLKKFMPPKAKLHVGLPSDTPVPFVVSVPEAPLPEAEKEHKRSSDRPHKRKRDHDSLDVHFGKKKKPRHSIPKVKTDDTSEPKEKSQSTPLPSPSEPAGVRTPRQKRNLSKKNETPSKLERSPREDVPKKQRNLSKAHQTSQLIAKYVSEIKSQLQAINYCLAELPIRQNNNNQDTLNERRHSLSCDTDELEWSDSSVSSSGDSITDQMLARYLESGSVDEDDFTQADFEILEGLRGEDSAEEEMEISDQVDQSEESEVESVEPSPPPIRKSQRTSSHRVSPSPMEDSRVDQEFTALKISARRWNPLLKADEFFTEWDDGTFTWEPHESFVDELGTKTQCYLAFLENEEKKKLRQSAEIKKSQDQQKLKQSQEQSQFQAQSHDTTLQTQPHDSQPQSDATSSEPSQPIHTEPVGIDSENISETEQPMQTELSTV